MSALSGDSGGPPEPEAPQPRWHSEAAMRPLLQGLHLPHTGAGGGGGGGGWSILGWGVGGCGGASAAIRHRTKEVRIVAAAMMKGVNRGVR